MMQNTDNKYLTRCLQLAAKGLSRTKTNPMVGCVIVFQEKILSEGYHKKHGGLHAESEAISRVEDKNKLKGSTMYVSLEPCHHYGKQPPCVDLILKYQIPKVVVLSPDPDPRTSGKSISKLRAKGVEVIVCKDEHLLLRAKKLNRSFFTNIKLSRPYLILKYAQTQDGFIAPLNHQGVYRISRQTAHRWAHIMRAQEDGCLVGKHTVLKDNPRLDLRYWAGISPQKIILNGNSFLPKDRLLQQGSGKTLVFCKYPPTHKVPQVSHFKITKKNWKETLFNICLTRGISSVIVEGGAITLQHFLKENLWDEIWLFISNKKLSTGIKAPKLDIAPSRKLRIDTSDRLFWYRNKKNSPL